MLQVLHFPRFVSSWSFLVFASAAAPVNPIQVVRRRARLGPATCWLTACRGLRVSQKVEPHGQVQCGGEGSGVRVAVMGFAPCWQYHCTACPILRREACGIPTMLGAAVPRVHATVIACNTRVRMGKSCD